MNDQYQVAREDFEGFVLQLFWLRLISFQLALNQTRAGLYEQKPAVISVLLILRRELKTIHATLKNDLEIDLNALEPRHQQALLSQGSASTRTDRLFRSMDPQNLDWLKETLREDILSDRTLSQVLLRRPRTVFFPTPSPAEATQAEACIDRLLQEKLKSWDRSPAK